MISMSLSRAAAAIHARLQGDDIVFNGCSTDTRTLEQGSLFVALQGEHFDGHDYVADAEQAGASSLLLAKEVEHSLPVLKVKDTRKALGLLARSWREELAMPLVAITGSNGKTTVKEMVKSILSEVAEVHATTANYNNDIGVPLTLFGLNKNHRYAVIEMGANHPGEIAWLSSVAHPNVAVITQCAPAHLEGFGSVDGVARAKAEIFSGLQATGTAIINADDDYASYWQGVTAVNKRCTFGIHSESADVKALDIRINAEQAATNFTLHSKQGDIEVMLPLLGEHNVMNALAASACCQSLGINQASIKAGLENMHAVKGRMQIKSGRAGVRVIDDTYNANPTSLEAALSVLSGFQGKRLLVLGDMGELGENAERFHADAGTQAKNAGIDGLLTAGQLSRAASDNYGAGASHFEAKADLLETLLKDLDKDTTILIKGSRSMQMETIVNALLEVS